MNKNIGSSEDSPKENQSINKPPKKRFGLIRRIIIYSLIVLSGLLAVIYLLLYFYFNPYLKKQIKQTVYESSDHLYILDLEDLNISLINSRINIEQVHLRVNPEEVRNRQAKRVKGNYLDLELKVNELSVEGIHWLKFLITKRLHIEKILLNQPDIYSLNQRLSPRKQAATELSTEVISIFSQFCEELILDDFSIIDSKVNIKAIRPKQVILHEAQKFDIHLADLHIHTHQDSLALSNIKFGLAQFESASYRFYSTDGGYQFQFDELRISTNDSLFQLSNFKILPRDTNTVDFLAKKNTRIDLNVKEIKAKGLDFKRLIYQQEIDLDNLLIDQLKMDVAQNVKRKKKKANINEVITHKKKSAPDREAFKKALLGIPLYIQMDHIHVKDAAFLIKQVNPQKPSEVLSYHQLDTVSLKFKNLSLGQAIDTTLKLPLNSRNVELDIRNYTHLSPDGIAKLFIKQARISARDSIMQIRDAYLKPLISNEAFSARTSYQKMLIDGKVELLQAKQLDFERMVFHQEFALGRVDLKAPKFKAYLDKRKPKKKTQKYRNFEQVIRSIPLYIEVDTFALSEASFEYVEQRNSPLEEAQFARHKAQDIQLQITDTKFGLAINQSTFEDIHKKSLALELENYTYDAPNGDYRLGIRRIEVSSKKASIHLDSFQLAPLRSREEIAQRHAYRYNLANIEVDHIQGGTVNFKRLLLSQEIDWGSLKLVNPKLDIYSDRRKPRQPHSNKQVNRNPNLTENSGLRRMLREIPAYIKIDTFQVQNASLNFQAQAQSNIGKGISSHYVDSVNFIFSQIRLGKATTDADFEHFYSGNFLLTLKNYRFQDKEDEFVFTLKNIKSSLKDSLLQIQSLRYQPLKTRDKFIADRPYRRLYLEAKLSSIQANTIDLDRLIFDQELILKELFIRQPQINLFTDKRKPKKAVRQGQAKSLEEILEAVPIHIKMDTFAIIDASLEFDALSTVKKSGKLGMARHRVEKLNLSARDIALGLNEYSEKLSKADRLLYSEDFQISFENYTFWMPNKEYLIRVESMKSSLADSAFSLKNISYQPQLSAAAFDSLHIFRKPQFNIQVNQIKARMADVRQIINNKAYVLRNLTLDDVDLNIYQNSTKPRDTSKIPLDTDKIFAKLPLEIRIDQLALNNARLNYLTKKRNKKGQVYTSQQKADSIYLVLNHFQIDPKQNSNVNRILFSDHLNLRLANYQTLSADSLYQIGLKAVNINTADSSLSIQGFRVNPTVSDLVFNSHQRFETDRFDMNISSIKGKAIDFLKLMNEKELTMGNLTLDELQADIYRDKRLDDDPNRRPTMPHTAFKKIKFPLEIDSIQINNSTISYKEQVPKGVGTGEVFFNQFHLNIFNLNTDINRKDTTRLNLQARLMGEGLFTLDLKIPLKADSLACTYEGSLAKMEASFFNSFVQSNQHMKITDGFIDKISYQASMENAFTKGSMDAGFKRLKIQFLNQKDHEKTKGALSFLANLVIHNNKDLERKKPKSSRIKYEADETDGFVKILWKSLASGLVRALL